MRKRRFRPLSLPRAACQPSIAVVIPAYRVALLIADVIARIPPEVAHIIVVDDASPDHLQAVLQQLPDPRLFVLSHHANRGVGGAMKTGFAKALDLEADIIVKIDGDGQMDPRLIPQFVAPILAGHADMSKGNRFVHFAYIRKMPLIRRVGNVALSFLTKVASGYWRVFDPCNGYLAIRASLVRSLDVHRLSDRYFFEISLLCEMYFARAVVEDIPMLPVYGDETSSLRPWRMIVNFAPKLMGRMLYRIGMSYFLRDFNVVSLLLATGMPAFGFGVAWSVYHWGHSMHVQQFTSTGTVMIGVLAIVLGFQLLLQALALDVANEPGRARR
ncbi:MAG: glycosyltransferase family 2 protein [Deltaproteobacteria bacterium]|nr:glycosyltransferase family 2 protein [Deltaproteobacteria bacterium]